MYHLLLNRFVILLTLCSFCLQGCRSSWQITSEEPAPKKARRTSGDEQAPGLVLASGTLSSTFSGGHDSGLPMVLPAVLPSATASAAQLTSPTHYPAVEPDVVPSWQALPTKLEEEEIDTKPAAKPTLAFGAREWAQYFGEVGAAPPLPSDVDQILSSPCPFRAGQQIRDTHLLVLVPATVAGKPFSLNLLGELIKHPKGGGHPTGYRGYTPSSQEQFFAQSPEGSYWVLMTREVLEGSRSKKYTFQKTLVARHASRTGLPYELPGVLEAATAILSHYVRSRERLYSDNPWTYTRCRELISDQYPAVVGKFSNEGLAVGHHDFVVPTKRSGVAALLKLTETERLLSLDTYQSWRNSEIRVESAGVLRKQSEALPVRWLAGERTRLLASLKEELLASERDRLLASLREELLASLKAKGELLAPQIKEKPKKKGPAEGQAPLSTTAMPAKPFGAEEWRQYFGEVGQEPSLPTNIDDILNSTCPFWPEKVVKDTHLLVLIPAAVGGKPFSLNLLRKLIQYPQGGGYSTKYNYANGSGGVQKKFGAQSPERSYWVLMTREVLEDSRDKDYASQQALVTAHAKRTGLPYELPGVLEAVTAILSHYVRSGERLYVDDPETYTRCQELVAWSFGNRSAVVGGFCSGGLFVRPHEISNIHYGVAGLRKFPGTDMIPSQAFGAEEWRRYFGEVDVDTVPTLPPNIGDILNSPCPFWPGRLVKDTHLLVLVPATVNGKPFSLDLLGELIQYPRGGGYSTEYSFYSSNVQQPFGTQSPVASYWVLMTRDVLEGSRNKTYASQKDLVAGHAERTKLPYELPGALEAATAILSHYVRSGERLYSDAPWTYTRCRELVAWNGGNNYPAAVGGFSSGGLFVDYGSSIDSDSLGVAGLRKF